MHVTAKYFITFTPQCSALTVAAIGAELGAILLNIIAKFHNFCAALLILRAIANSAHLRILTPLTIHKKSAYKQLLRSRYSHIVT